VEGVMAMTEDEILRDLDARIEEAARELSELQFKVTRLDQLYFKLRREVTVLRRQSVEAP
jgi:predicted  nucleic acid-binding Zn-ribbon protein